MATEPVNLGEANGAFKRSVGLTTAVSAFASNAVCAAVETGLFASVVLLTFSNARSVFVIVILPSFPLTDCTGGAGVNSSIQFANNVGFACAKTKFLFKSVLITTLPTTASVNANISA